MGDMDNDFLNFSPANLGDKNAGYQQHSNNESDDFEKLDPYQVQDQGEDNDFMVTSSSSEVKDDDFFQSSSAHVAHSTDRPLVTVDETSPSAPSLSPVRESNKFEDTEFDRQQSQFQLGSSYGKDDADEFEVSQSSSRQDLHEFDPYEMMKSEPTVQQTASSHSQEEEEEIKPSPSPCYEPETIVEKPSELKQRVVEPVTKMDDQTTPKKNTQSPSPDSCGNICPLRAWLEKLDPKVLELVYWRDPKKSGIVFGGILAILLSLTIFSLISVVAYIVLVILAVTLTFRIYKSILAAVQKSNEGHPFNQYLEKDIAISGSQINDIVETIVAHVNAITSEVRRLVLVEDIVDSIKFGLFLYCLTYIGAWFNGLTLLILLFVGAFSLPKVYETNKTQIDHYIGLVSTQVNDVLSKVKAKLPIGRKPKEQ